MFNKKEYYVKRYNTDKEYREKIIKAVLNYQRSKKGQIKIKKYKKTFLEKYPNYYKDYAKRYREEAKLNGVCNTCFKNKVSENYYTCQECREKHAKIKKEQRENETGVLCHVENE